jgi:hypothetical protein
VILRGHLDGAYDAGVQSGQIVGGDPVLQDGLAPDRVDPVLIQERPQDLESGDVPGAWTAIRICREWRGRAASQWGKNHKYLVTVVAWGESQGAGPSAGHLPAQPGPE